jgi:hypothetical protein
MGLGDELYKLTHPSNTHRDELLKTGVESADKTTVQWGKVTFTATEFQDFKKNMKGMEFDSKMVETLRAVHDGKPPPTTAEVGTKTTTQELMSKATTDKDGNLHIGKLVVDKGLVSDFTKVMKEGVPDQEFTSFIEKASKDGRHIIQDQGANSRADHQGNVYWDNKHVASDFHNEASMSARDVLKHEMSHSMRDPEVQRVLMGIPKGSETNFEEHFAIEAEHRHMDPNQMQRGSHEANTVRSQADVNKAPQYSMQPELAVSVQEIGPNGNVGSSVYKSTGQLRGQVQNVSHDAKAGTETITILDQRGKLQNLTFREQTIPYASSDPGTGWPDHPIKTLTSEIRPGDDIGLKFDPKSQTATLENRTQSTEKTVDPQGQVVSARSVDFNQKQPALSSPSLG